MRTVYRHPIPIDDCEHQVKTSAKSTVLMVGAKAGFPSEIQMWIEQDPESTVQMMRTVRVFGTGHPIPEGWQALGSVVAEPFVWHLYEKR